MTRIHVEIDDKKKACFTLDDQGVLWFKNRLVVPKDVELRKKILDEAHASMFTIHPGSNKMYQDLKQKFWWTRMKREIAKYVSECDVCQRRKPDHLKPAGMLQPLAFPAWKWEDVHMYFIVGLHHTQKGVPRTITSDRGSLFVSRFWEQLHAALGTNLVRSSAYHPQTSGKVERVNQILEDMLRAFNQKSLEMAPFEALYGGRCLTPLHWSEPGERVTFGLDLVTQAKKQKSYSDRRRRPLVFEKGDHMYLRVSPMKGVHQFGVKGKLAPRYVDPFQIMERCGTVAYQLELPPHLAAVHDVFESQWTGLIALLV
ncbi:hypothetical protein U9M48_036346 [Paspalum notatum var. saurae]|uniref:Integrase catalytic domain-containing protein n=1 Tax=Paspalum notatum var. saurae TaxID=547442 RepID=A0AAQ3UF08_PASNO